MTEPRMRAGTSDRQASVDALTRHFTEGRLDPDEFDERVGKAYAAKYLDELPALVADLPDDRTARGHAVGAGRTRYPAVATGCRPAAWSAGQHPQRVGPPRVLVLIPVLAGLALLFTVAALSHGVFPFPLIWIALVLLFLSGRARRRRWAAGHRDRY